ncbi:MAG: hypothetical protein RBU37_10910 [Myxococcota bacterium]|nr:hypothetical protein [Myxococcota bacterium]
MDGIAIVEYNVEAQSLNKQSTCAPDTWCVPYYEGDKLSFLQIAPDVDLAGVAGFPELPSRSGSGLVFASEGAIWLAHDDDYRLLHYQTGEYVEIDALMAAAQAPLALSSGGGVYLWSLEEAAAAAEVSMEPALEAAWRSWFASWAGQRGSTAPALDALCADTLLMGESAKPETVSCEDWLKGKQSLYEQGARAMVEELAAQATDQGWSLSFRLCGVDAEWSGCSRFHLEFARVGQELRLLSELSEPETDTEAKLEVALLECFASGEDTPLSDDEELSSFDDGPRCVALLHNRGEQSVWPWGRYRVEKKGELGVWRTRMGAALAPGAWGYLSIAGNVRLPSSCDNTPGKLVVELGTAPGGRAKAKTIRGLQVFEPTCDEDF